MRTWSTYFLALLFLAGCSTSSTTGVSDVSDGDLDVRSRDDLPPTDMSLEVDTHSDTKPDEVEVTDPCAPPAELLCPCEDGKDCLSGFCELHLGERICTQACVEECPPGYGCVQYSAGGPDAGHVCMSLYPSLCVPCVTKGDCHGVDDCFVHGPEAGTFCSPWCNDDLACPEGFTCTALDTASGASGQGCIPNEGECFCSEYSTHNHMSTPCEITNQWGTCGGVRICEEDGLSPCSAPIPEDEVCGDGVDNDCNGETDPLALCLDCSCGDGDCDPACGEDVAGDDFCPADCCLCGDGVCDPDPCGEGWEEGTKTCALDCAICGDDVCDPAEGPQACPEDCCGTCGDGKCKCSEDPDLCPVDCGQWACGDGTCNPGENPVDCIQDCEPYACGNGTCEPGEGPATCPDDCGSACGNCVCEGGESYDTCPVDCGFCGDGLCISKCDYNEETSDNCPQDCPPACVPVCDGKECGGDTCGGICGACTGQDACVAGLCVCQPACGGKNCGDDGCGGSCGECVDEDPCNGEETCEDGQCVEGIPPDCDDDNPCTTDSCIEGEGCLNDPVPDKAEPDCDDGNPCTENVCVLGVCANPLKDLEELVIEDCLCGADEDCESLEDDDLCNGILVCDTEVETPTCMVDPETLVVCSELAPGSHPDCNAPACEPTTGQCTTVWANEDQGCNDGEACTQGETCVEGQCTDGGPVSCDDGNDCTEDSCTPAEGCQYAPLWGQPCDDEEFCTPTSACSGDDGTVCEGAGWEACDDGNPCTSDQCIEGGVGCYNSANDDPCEDGDLCTVGDLCAEEFCVPGGSADCDDGNDCTEDSCTPAEGCTNAPLNGTLCADDAGVCVAGGCCIPFCDGKDCGDDGCGGSCGECGQGWACGLDGLCEAQGCVDGVIWDLDLDDGVVPAGWTQTLVSGGPGVFNLRFEAHPVDGAAVLHRPYSPPPGAEKLVLEWDGSHASSAWGLRTSVTAWLGDEGSKMKFQMYTASAQQNVGDVNKVTIGYWHDGEWEWLQDVDLPQEEGEFHYKVELWTEHVSYTATWLQTGSPYFSYAADVPVFSLDQISGVSWEVHTTSPMVWADNFIGSNSCTCVPACAGKDCGDDGCGGSCGECDIDLEECTEVTTGEWVCAAKLVEIPAGNFWMGCNNCAGSTVDDPLCENDEHPYHEVYLDAYEIDKTELTADQYAACVSTGACTSAGTGEYCTWQQAGMANHPINCVTWTQVEAYCLWAGKDLCTEAQWEKGARGGCEHNGGSSNCKAQSRHFSWGNDVPTCDLAVMDGCEGETQEVCSMSPAGDSPYGLCDMPGNVWELVADWYQKDFYCDGYGASGDEYCPECGSWPGSPAPWNNPYCEVSGSGRAIRGGSFYDTGAISVSFRHYVDLSFSDDYLGGRCCRSSCGDGVCDGAIGEDCSNCIQDCGCPDGDVCDDGACVPCAPDCDGKVCGDDGCGGSCGECAENEVCMVDGTCFCIPDCAGKDCGDDGCGGTCGECDACGDGCVEGQCIYCGGKQCGDDGCGGSCGDCDPDFSCVENLCECTVPCEAMCCAGTQVCNNEKECCDPQCIGKECGPDGCDSTCGECGDQEICLAEGTCLCIPDCASKDCGGDGCGGSCGDCDGGETCFFHDCVPEECDDGNDVDWDGCTQGVVTEILIGSQPKLQPGLPMQKSPPDVAVLADGGYVVAWIRCPSWSSSLCTLVYRRVDASGVPQAEVEFGIGRMVSLVSLTDGRVALVFEPTDGTLAGDLWVRFFDEEGVLGDTPVQLLTGQTGQKYVSLVSLASGGFALSWDKGKDIWVQRFDAQGVKLEDAFTVNVTDLGSWNYSQILPAADGSFFVAWRHSDPLNTGYLHVRPYNSLASPLSEPTLLDSAQGQVGADDFLRGARLPSGDFVLTWEAQNRFYGDDLGPLTDLQANSTKTEAGAYAATTAVLGTDSVVLVWTEYPEFHGGGNRHVKQRFFSDAGIPEADEVIIDYQQGGQNDLPVVAPYSNGDYVVAWVNWTGSTGLDVYIFAQQFNADGTKKN